MLKTRVETNIMYLYAEESKSKLVNYFSIFKTNESVILSRLHSFQFAMFLCLKRLESIRFPICTIFFDQQIIILIGYLEQVLE